MGLIPFMVSASDTIEQISTIGYDDDELARSVYIDKLQAFPSEYIDESLNILCMKLSVREDSNRDNRYKISGKCQLFQDKTKARSINPFEIQFVSVKRIAKQIVNEVSHTDKVILYGVLIENEDKHGLSKYQYVVNYVQVED